MGFRSPLCTRGISIERQGANYAHMALQVMHCMSPCSSYLIWLRVVVQWYLECHLCYHINKIIRNGLWGPAVHKRTLYWEAERQLCTYGFTSNALPFVILILPGITWNSFWLLFVMLSTVGQRRWRTAVPPPNMVVIKTGEQGKALCSVL